MSDEGSGGESGGGDGNGDGDKCESFSPTTLVTLSDGSNVPIDQVKVGESVMSTNQTTGKLEAKPVTALHLNLDTDLMNIEIRTSSGSTTIHATQHHLLYDLSTHHWTQADRLKDGDRLWTSNGILATVERTIVVAGSAEMWDLTVAGNHDFYVAANESAVLVHNCPDKGSKKGLGKGRGPSWFYDKYNKPPLPGETPVQAATRIMNKQFPEDNGDWPTGPGTDFNWLVKFFARRYFG